ncbi:hypothetical protein HII31_10893 [Pseudocercospora fuligena]|uniref:F-box domain-containing protein n=1 Tax=Pseudocercospora fuligena TaxID=685502 RepID=A0A8H6RBZ9_9PEZI|nr:hypothetical protein HII31_10893 [Pseudocercospora fuligena]
MCSKSIPVGTNQAESTFSSSASIQMNAPKYGTSTGFLDLPAELRNYIYELILTSDVETHMVRNKFQHNGWRAWRIRLNQVTAVWGAQILCVNRQLHAETKPILYGENSFVVNGNEGLGCFSQEVLPYIRSIRFDGTWSRLNELLVELESKAAKLKALESLAFTVRSVSVIGSFPGVNQYARVAKKLVPLLTAFMVARQLDIKDTIALVSFSAESDDRSAALPPSEDMIATAADCTAEVRKSAGELLEQAGWSTDLGFDELSGAIR